MTPRGFFINRQSCWKHPRNAFYLRGVLWTPSSSFPEPVEGVTPKTSWWLYVGPFTSSQEVGAFDFMIRRWAYSMGFVWWSNKATSTLCVWGPDAANGISWPADKSLQYTWVYEQPGAPLRALYRKYDGLPGRYKYFWEGAASQNQPGYHTDGLPGYNGV